MTCETCRWHKAVCLAPEDLEGQDLGEFTLEELCVPHKECCVPDGEPCPAEWLYHPDYQEHEGDSAYDRALALGLHPTEIPEGWKRL